MTKLIRCKVCHAPLALRSYGIMDAFTPQADRLRKKWRGKLKPSSKESELCAECYEKGENQHDSERR